MTSDDELESDRRTATGANDTPPRPTQIATSSTTTRGQPTKQPSDDADLEPDKIHRGVTGDEMDHGYQGHIRGTGDSDVGSSEQGSTDVDENGSLLSHLDKDDNHMMEMLSFDDVDKTIDAYAVVWIDVTELFSPARVTQVCEEMQTHPRGFARLG